MAPLLVTAALIRGDQGKILIARRRVSASVEGGKWEFPGGKVELCEHPEDCLVREIREELGFEIEVGKLFDLSSHVYDTADKKLHIVLLCYECRVKSGKPQALDVEEYRWITLGELDDFEFAAADHPFIRKLKAEAAQG